MSNSNITRSDVISYLKNLHSDEQLLLILKEVVPHDIDTNEDGDFIWNSGINSEDFSENEVDDPDNDDWIANDFPDWLNKNKPHHVQFYKDMVNAGYDEDSGLQHYRGRFYYDGPGIVVSRYKEDDIVRATKVSLQRDNMGLDMILYPNN